MKKIFFLVLFFSFMNLYSIEPIGVKDVPRYTYSTYNTEKVDSYDLYRFITMKGLPKIYFPQEKSDEIQPPLKEKPGPILTKSGISLVQITNDNDAQDETWIAVNPTNPLNAIATCNDNSTNGRGRQWRMPAYVTFDGGLTWEKRTTQNHNSPFILKVPAGRGATIFDPAITFNKDGKAIYAYGFAVDYGNNGENGIFLSISDDGGLTWNVTEDFDELYMAAYSPQGGGLQDRYTIAVDLWSDEYEGNVYIAWRDFSINQSINLGYAPKSNYQDWIGNIIVPNPATQAPVPCVDYKGQVWLSYRQTSAAEKTEAPIYLSKDGGNSFERLASAMDNWNIGTPRFNLPLHARVSLANKDSMRISTNPQLAIDNSNGPYRGNVYCIMPGKEGNLAGPTKIYLGILKNGVEEPENEWEVLAIDNNELGNDMFFPSVCVDPITGYVHVFYYTSQFDPDNILVDAMYAYSYDGGQTFKHKRLTDESFRVRAVGQADEGNRYWGDYARIEAYNNRVYPLFWAGKAPSFNYSSNELFTSLITTFPACPAIVDVNYDGANNEVDISWEGIADGLGEPINDYTVKLYKNGEFLAEFEQNQNSYTDQEITVGGEYSYGIQVVSNDLRGEGEICNYNVIAGGGLVLMPPTDFQALSHPQGILFRWKTPNRTEGGVVINDVSGIKIYHEDNLIATVPTSSVQAGEYNEYLWETDTETFYFNFHSTALRERDGEEGESLPSESLEIAYAGAPIENFAETFESEDAMVPTYRTGKWGITNQKASEGEYSLTQSPNEDYSNTEDSHIIFAPLIVKDNAPNLVFDIIALIRDKDYVMFEATNNNGQTWRFGNKTRASWAPELWDAENFSLENSNWFTGVLHFLDNGFKDGDTIMVKVSFKAIPIARAPGVFIDNMRMDNISNVRNTISSNSSLYPNPAKDEVNISFNISRPGNIKLEVFDLLSNNLMTIDKGYLSIGEYSEQININQLNSGNYFIRITDGINQKMIPFTIAK